MARRTLSVRGSTRRLLVAGLALAVMGLMPSCAAVRMDGSGDASAAIATPLATQPPAVGDAQLAARGALASEAALPPPGSVTAEELGAAASAVYFSTSGVSGARTEVSGTFFVPAGTPPPEGWPVVAWAHGTTGITQGCAPSMSANLWGDGGRVTSFLSFGFAVAFTDYEGLGERGEHPYLEPRTAAYNVIDSVRALRNLFPAVGTRWVAVGPSQGGQAAWAVNEVNRSYGSGLDLLGTVAMSPAVELSDLAAQATAKSLTPSQFLLLPLVIVGLSRYDPSIHVERFLRGDAVDLRESLIGCGLDLESARAQLTNAEDVGPTGVRDENDLRDALRRIALPQGPLSAPMFVVNGLNDDTVFPEWVSVAVKRSCRFGGVIQHDEVPSVGHNDLGSDELVLGWINDRFAGSPAPSNCGAS